MFRTPNRNKWRVVGRKAELEDSISISLVPKDSITSLAVNSISHSFQVEQEKAPSLSRSLWEVITYFAMHWNLEALYL
jgi:hypothetical protein